jgi:hypothetical protein
MPSASTHVKSSASRAADSKPLEYLARGGFVCYGVIHLLFAWVALQVAFGKSSQESDQSGAFQNLASKPFGKTLVIIIVVGMIALALWQAFEAIVGESGQEGKQAVAERVFSGIRTIVYLSFAWTGVKVLTGASSQSQNQKSGAATLMEHTGGRWLVGFIGLVVIGVGVGLAVYGAKKNFLKKMNTQRMKPSVLKTTTRVGMAGYLAKGLAYAIAGVLVVIAAVKFDPDKARGLDAALKTQAKYRKV